MWDYVSVSGSMEDGRLIEHVAQLHEHFLHPVTVRNARYFPPTDAGYSTEMVEDSAVRYLYPDGKVWRRLFNDETYWDPSLEQKRLLA